MFNLIFGILFLVLGLIGLWAYAIWYISSNHKNRKQ